MSNVKTIKTGVVIEPQSSDPTGKEGQLDYNSTDKRLKAHNGTAWKTQAEDPTTTEGDILYRNSAGDLDRLAIGSTGQVLTESSGVPAWQSSSAPVASVTAKTSTYTASTGDDLITVDSSGGTFTLTLYTSVGNSGKKIHIKKIDTSATLVTIEGNASETINGSLNTTVNTQFEGIELISDGSNWLLLRREGIITKEISYTPTTSGLGTITNVDFRYRRVGGFMEIKGFLKAGTTTATRGIIDIPSGFTMDSAKINSADRKGTVGHLDRLNASTAVEALRQVLYTNPSNLDGLYFTKTVATDDLYQNDNANDNVNTGDSINIHASIPIEGWKGDNE